MEKGFGAFIRKYKHYHIIITNLNSVECDREHYFSYERVFLGLANNFNLKIGIERWLTIQ